MEGSGENDQEDVRMKNSEGPQLQPAKVCFTAVDHPVPPTRNKLVPPPADGNRRGSAEFRLRLH